MISPALQAAFRFHRANFLSTPNALSRARRDVEANRAPRGPDRRTIEHGDVIRSRTPSGERRTYVVAILPDESMGAPWDEHDGHGVITESSRDKAPGERILQGNGRHATRYLYDVVATTAKARADGWGLDAAQMEFLAKRTLMIPTPAMIAAEAVRLDFEHCRAWLNDEWSWIGVALIEMPRGEECDPAALADAWAADQDRIAAGRIAASLWGIESNSPDYHSAVARELVYEADRSVR